VRVVPTYARPSYIEEIEKVQKRATKLVSACKTLSYEQRLIYLKLSTVKYRREGDIIETYKTLNKFYDERATAPRLMQSYSVTTINSRSRF